MNIHSHSHTHTHTYTQPWGLFRCPLSQKIYTHTRNHTHKTPKNAQCLFSIHTLTHSHTHTVKENIDVTFQTVHFSASFLQISKNIWTDWWTKTIVCFSRYSVIKFFCHLPYTNKCPEDDLINRSKHCSVNLLNIILVMKLVFFQFL